MYTVEQFITSYAPYFTIACFIIMAIVFVLLLNYKKKFERFKEAQEKNQENMQMQTQNALQTLPKREEMATHLYGVTQQLTAHHDSLNRDLLLRFDAFDRRLDDVQKGNDEKALALQTSVENKLVQNEQRMEKLRETLENSVRALKTESSAQLEKMRETLENSVSSLKRDSSAQFDDMRKMLDEKLLQNENRIEKMRETLQNSVSELQKENAKKLDEMRQTVDEKLHSTLEKRLSESFSQVTNQLDLVSKGLGEMRALATGVGDLKKVLTNVKTRGIWGEMQLGMLLEQMLPKNQYEENVQINPKSNERVEYAIKLPGQKDEPVFLPIDAKFPIESYEKLMNAVEQGDTALIALCEKALANAIKTEAKRITKYILPPLTTDFAIMFLPTEGLYAEALRIRGLTEELQETHRIIVAGPTTLTALLTSLQVGFKTLAIEKSSSDVWKLLSAVKTDFARFTELLDVAQKRMQSASKSIEQASSRSRTITRKLKNVEEMDTLTATQLLDSGVVEEIEEIEIMEE